MQLGLNLHLRGKLVMQNYTGRIKKISKISKETQLLNLQTIIQLMHEAVSHFLSAELHSCL